MPSTVVLAWELGGGYGHIHPLWSIGDALMRRGHNLVVIVKELHRAEVAFGGLGIPILQAPMAARARTRPSDLCTLGQTLGMAGYDCVEHFGPIYRAWRVLLESVGPALVVGDYAPTGLLAARGLGIPRIEVGNGWTTPPLSIPSPHLSPWKTPPSRDVLLAREGKIVAVVNRVLQRCGDEPIGALADLHDTEDRFLLTFPELDHFGPRPESAYLGTLASGHATDTPPWPAGDGPRIFGYLSARYGGFDRLVAQLGTSGRPTLIHARDLEPARAKAASTPSLRFSPGMVDVSVAFGQADLVVSHGGHGTASQALLHGCPLLVLPEHDEQALTGHNLARAGMGVSVGHRLGVEHDYGALVDTLATEDKYRVAAARFAARHADFDQAASVVQMADRCEALIERG
ncbi:MAG: hypothetical protein AAF721_21185 [Myxococcota bacterium]